MKYFQLNKPFFRRILFHALYWILNVLFFTVYFSSRDNFNGFFTMLLGNLVYLPGGMLFAYFSIYYLLPKFFFEKQIVLYIVLQTAVLFLYPVLSGFLTLHVTDPYIWHSTTHFKLASHLSTIIVLIIGMVPIVSVKIAQRFILDNAIKETLEKAKIEAELKVKEAELKLLKAQINPHFLFNTLNNLYSLAIEKSEKTAEVILKISELLSYITYECISVKVTLVKEIEFINSYIELEKLRYDENLTLTFSKSGDFSEQYIAPMILYTFIENSFKHGASKDAGNPWIMIDLNLNEECLSFSVSNSKVADKLLTTTGIGIENVKKRLELLYPGRHRLKIVEEERVYFVSLDIQLSKNGSRYS